MSNKKTSNQELLQEQALRQQEEIQRKQARILKRQQLQTYEPVVYRVLDQALKQNEVSHAYLFTGPKGCFKSEAAILLAQSILCESDTGFIEEEHLNEEESHVARRVGDNNYADFLFLDGYRKEAISREDVGNIMSLFSLTSMEKSNRKVYVLDHVENTTISAMNALLKFLEEPADNVYAILTTDNIERILPTIVSRCVLVPFRGLSKEIYQELIRQEGLDEEDVFLMSQIMEQTEGFSDFVVKMSYQRAKEMFQEYIEVNGENRLFLVNYEVNYRLRPKDVEGGNAKDENLDTLRYFFGMLSGFYRNVIKGDKEGPTWYSNAIKKARKQSDINYARLLEITIEERDRCNRVNDLNLLLDQAIYRLEEEKHVRI